MGDWLLKSRGWPEDSVRFVKVYFADEPAVMELELIEPELFLRFWEPSAIAFARAIKAELES